MAGSHAQADLDVAILDEDLNTVSEPVDMFGFLARPGDEAEFLQALEMLGHRTHAGNPEPILDFANASRAMRQGDNDLYPVIIRDRADEFTERNGQAHITTTMFPPR